MVVRIGPSEPFRHYLREWRMAKKLTQQQLADRLETSKDQVSRFENGKRKMTMDMAAAFAFGLGIDPLDIFRDPEQPSADALLKSAPPDVRRQALAVIETLLKTGT